LLQLLMTLLRHLLLMALGYGRLPPRQAQSGGNLRLSNPRHFPFARD
jgi:hypothetical protein